MRWRKGLAVAALLVCIVLMLGTRSKTSLVCLMAGLGLIGGWQWWQKQQQSDRMATSAMYAQAVNASDTTRARAQITALGNGVLPLQAVSALSMLHDIE